MRIRGTAVLVLSFCAALAQATVLPPTGSSPVAPTAFGTTVAGPFLANTGVQSFSATNSLGQTTISGTYDATVYSDPGNVFCSGCLDFFITVTSSSTSTDDIERITLANFGQFLVSAGYSVGKDSNPSGVDPITVDRSSNGNVIGFDFNVPNGVPAGGETEVLEIQTNATTFVTGTLQIIDSSVASVPAFEPGNVVPEANSISLTLLGGLFLAAGVIGRRRRRA